MHAKREGRIYDDHRVVLPRVVVCCYTHVTHSQFTLLLQTDFNASLVLFSLSIGIISFFKEKKSLALLYSGRIRL